MGWGGGPPRRGSRRRRWSQATGRSHPARCRNPPSCGPPFVSVSAPLLQAEVLQRDAVAPALEALQGLVLAPRVPAPHVVGPLLDTSQAVPLLATHDPIAQHENGVRRVEPHAARPASPERNGVLLDRKSVV